MMVAMIVAMRAAMTVVALGLVLLAGAVAPAFAQAQTSFIADVRPTVIEPGQPLVIECPGLKPGQPVEVMLEGRRAEGVGGFRYLDRARAVSGDRVLLNLRDPGRLHLVRVQVEVQQGGRTWRLRLGYPL